MKEVKFEVEEKGYERIERTCPNCGELLTLYTDEEGVIRKSVDVKIIDSHHVKCIYCKSILKY